MNRFYDIPGIPSRELLPWEAGCRGLSKTDGLFELLERIRLRSDIAGGDIVVDPPFVSNLASIPGSVAWYLTTDDQRIAGGAWFHDYLYTNAGNIPIYSSDGTFIQRVQLTRAQCDSVLAFEAMPDLGASKAMCQTVYQTLRRFGDQWSGQGFTERFTG